MSDAAADVPQKAKGLEVHIVDEQCVVYDTVADRIHYLSPTAALVLEFCDGEHSVEAIAALIQQAYGLAASPLGDVNRCVASLKRTDLVG